MLSLNERGADDAVRRGGARFAPAQSSCLLRPFGSQAENTLSSEKLGAF